MVLLRALYESLNVDGSIVNSDRGLFLLHKLFRRFPARYHNQTLIGVCGMNRGKALLFLFRTLGCLSQFINFRRTLCILEDLL